MYQRQWTADIGRIALVVSPVQLRQLSFNIRQPLFISFQDQMTGQLLFISWLKVLALPQYLKS